MCRGYPRGYKLFTCKCGCVNVGAILQKEVDQNEVFSLNCIVKGSAPTTCILFEEGRGKGGGGGGEREKERERMKRGGRESREERERRKEEKEEGKKKEKGIEMLLCVSLE